MKVVLLRLGHRKQRDQRTTTHCALAARALGAGGMWYTGEKDPGMEEAVTGVAGTWGGRFFVRHADGWKKVLRLLKRQGFVSVHLTMYGLPYEKKIPALRRKNIVVVVGGGKVPKEVYYAADYNMAVTSQPHSEVAALGVFLERLGVNAVFTGARLRVVPQERGKKVVGRRV